jgi:hypothetical protein
MKALVISGGGSKGAFGRYCRISNTGLLYIYELFVVFNRQFINASFISKVKQNKSIYTSVGQKTF